MSVITLDRRTAVTTAAGVTQLGTILGVWAHPDDEAYLSGGVMAAAAAAGNRVVVLTATRGEHGTDDPTRWPPARLAPHRTRELADSLAVLDRGTGRIEHRFLGDPTSCYLDGALARARSDRPAAEIAAIIDEVVPDTVLTFGHDGFTGHPDHRTISTWTDLALRQVNVGSTLLHATLTTDWQREFGGLLAPMDDGDDAFTVTPRSDLAVALRLAGDDLDRKVAALRAQASQTGPLRQTLGHRRYREFVAEECFRPRSANAVRLTNAA